MTIHVKTLGDGRDVVLLHGWGLNLGVWDNIAPLMARRWRIHLVELPGHGLSGINENAFSLDSVANAILEVTPSSAHWLGWSLGGTVAMHVALTQPQRIDKLILVSSTPQFVSAPDWPHGIAPAVFRQFADDLISDYPATMRRFLNLQVLGSAQSRALVQRLRQQLLARPKPNPNALEGGLGILEKTNLAAVADQIPHPTLLVHGDRDMLAPHSAAKALSRLIANARLVTFSDTGHAPFINQSTAFISEISSFLNER